MARQNEGPWFHSTKDTWYLTVEGKNRSLKVRGEKNKKQAIQAWHELMSRSVKKDSQKPLEASQKVKEASTVEEVVDAFLSDAKARVKPTTWKNYDAFLTHFTEAMGSLKAEALTVAKVIAYSNREGWGQAHRYNLLGAIKTAFKWAEEVGIIGRIPSR